MNVLMAPLFESTIVLGTHNQKKLFEMQELLTPLGISLQTLDGFADAIEVEETGTTFEENAVLKAVEQAQLIQQWVLAEDSGLCVDALDGAPGVYSKRYSGPGATDESNNALLLEQMQSVPLEKRTGHYVCVMALADPEGKIRVQARGEFHGRIRFEPIGSGGFGYDPLFEILEYHRTVGQLGGSIKRALSHRARAMRKLVRALHGLQQDSKV